MKAVVHLTEGQTRDKSNTKQKLLHKRIEQDATLLSSPLLNGSIVVSPLSFCNVDDDEEEDEVDILLGRKVNAVSFPIIAWIPFDSLLCGALAVLGSGSMESRSELAVEGGKRGSAVALEKSRDTDMLVGVDASCVVEAYVEIAGLVPIDAVEGIEESGLSADIPVNAIELANVNGSDTV